MTFTTVALRVTSWPAVPGLSTSSIKSSSIVSVPEDTNSNPLTAPSGTEKFCRTSFPTSSSYPDVASETGQPVAYSFPPAAISMSDVAPPRRKATTLKILLSNYTRLVLITTPPRDALCWPAGP